MQIHRLQLGSLYVVDDPWPVHGFAILHPSLGVVLVDTGCGGPDSLLREYRVVNRSVADALGEHGLSPADVKLVINTHLHFDHCGQNAVFRHARFCVQREEFERVRREGGPVLEWLESAGTEFELLDGDTALTDDLRVVATPGHTAGHQSVIATAEQRIDLFVGDAAFTRTVWRAPEAAALAPGQADDVESWHRSLKGLHALLPTRLHFCHDAS